MMSSDYASLIGRINWSWQGSIIGQEWVVCIFRSSTIRVDMVPADGSDTNMKTIRLAWIGSTRIALNGFNRFLLKSYWVLRTLTLFNWIGFSLVGHSWSHLVLANPIWSQGIDANNSTSTGSHWIAFDCIFYAFHLASIGVLSCATYLFECCWSQPKVVIAYLVQACRI